MRSNALFSLWNEVTSHPRKLPALRAEVDGVAPSRRHAFILHFFRPPGSRRHKLRIIRLAASGKAPSLRCSASPNRNRFAYVAVWL